MTAREMRAWRIRIRRESSKPDRSDWYAAQIAKTIYDLIDRFNRKTELSDLKTFILKPADEGKVEPEPVAEEAKKQSMADVAKALWKDRLKDAPIEVEDNAS